MKKIFDPISISGKALKHFRSKNGLTQGEMANLLGLSRPTYTNWETKESLIINEKHAKILEKSLHVTTNALQKTTNTQREEDILDHPLVRSLITQSEYIMKRVNELEEENRRLRSSNK